MAYYIVLCGLHPYELGIIDKKFNEFVDPKRGVYDYPGYYRARKVDYVAEYYDINRDPNTWSPLELKGMKRGEILERGGVRFERLGRGVTKLTYPNG